MILNLRPTIRFVLDQTGRYKLPEAALRRNVRLQLDMPLDGFDPAFEKRFQEDLKWLHDKNQIDFAFEHETETKRWFLNPSGGTA